MNDALTFRKGAAARSDAATQFELDKLESLLETLQRIHALVQSETSI